MEEQKNNNTFEYTYSAPTEAEKKQIESIKRQYESPQKPTESKVERVKRLDAKIKNTANAFSIALGVVGCLIFGLGLTMILEWDIWLWGVAVMALGCPLMIFAYPLYNFLIKKGKKKYGAEILRLSEEILKK